MKLPKRLKIHKAADKDAGPAFSTVVVASNAVAASDGRVIAGATRENPREITIDPPKLYESEDVRAYSSVGLHLDKANHVPQPSRPTSAQSLGLLARQFRGGQDHGSIEITAGHLRRALDAIGADASTIVRISVVEDSIGVAHLELSGRLVAKCGDDLAETWLAAAIITGLRKNDSKPLPPGAIVLDRVAADLRNADDSEPAQRRPSENEDFCRGCGVVFGDDELTLMSDESSICPACLEAYKPKASEGGE